MPSGSGCRWAPFGRWGSRRPHDAQPSSAELAAELEFRDHTGAGGDARVPGRRTPGDLFDGCDAALVGFAQRRYRRPGHVYDYDQLVKVFRPDMGEEAPWVGVVRRRGQWAGDGTPLILHRHPTE
jgi:hypothetical protein